MKKRIVFIFLVCLVTVNGMAGKPGEPEDKAPEVSVVITYIANEGFLIESDSNKILIDALFGEEPYSFCDNPTEAAIQDMVKARGEFKDVDLVAVTHSHRDHFYAPFVAGHMASNPASRFISCQQSVELLSETEEYESVSKRVMEITPDSLLYIDTRINDIGVRIYRLAHGPYLVEDPKTGKSINRHRHVQNLGFLFDLGGFKVFHCGDSSPRCLEDYEHFRLDQEGIDVAIMGRGFLASSTGFGVEILRDLVKAEHLILMHIHHEQNPYYLQMANQVKDEIPSVTIFESRMDSKTFSTAR